MRNIEQLLQIDENTLQQLLEVWEGAVKATHTFLTDQDIIFLKPLVKVGLQQVESVFCVRNGLLQPEAFMGINGDKLEMLFVRSESRGNGIGKCLIEYAIENCCIRYVDVNEQNPQAIGFYEHLGFHCFARSERDGQGNAFPVLHMVRA